MGFESPDFYVFYFNLKWFEPFHLRFFMVCQSPKTLSCQGFQSIKQPHQIRKSHRLVRIGWGHSFWSCWADSNCRPHPYQDWLVVVPLCSSPVFCCNSLSVFNALTIFRQISIVVCCSLLSAEKVLSSRFFSRFFKSLLFCVGWKPWGNDAARQLIYLEIASTIRALFQAQKSKSYPYLIGFLSPPLTFSLPKM